MGNRENTKTDPISTTRIVVVLALGPLLMRFGAEYGCTGGPRLGGPVPKGAKGSSRAALSLLWRTALLPGDGEDCIMVLLGDQGTRFLAGLSAG